LETSMKQRNGKSCWIKKSFFSFGRVSGGRFFDQGLRITKKST